MDRRIFYSIGFLVSFMLGVSILATYLNSEPSVTVVKPVTHSGPTYTIQATYDEKQEEVRGKMNVVIEQQMKEPLKEVYFHLYPNAFKNWKFQLQSKPTREGYLRVSNVCVDGKKVTERIEGTVMKVMLPNPLSGGKTANITLNYTLHLPHGGTRLNQFKHTAFLAQWYPMLAVKDKEGWHTDPYTTVGDPFYTTLSHFKVTMNIPKGYHVISTGTDKKQVWNKEKNEVTLTQENVRDFAVVISKDYKVVSKQVDDVTVNLWYLPGMEDVTKELSEASVSGMQYYGKHFGKYPYREVDVVLGETGHGIAGMEYPGLVTSVTKVPSRRGVAPAVNVVVHELAHQWWYGVVGNNQVKEPWLDEGLTTFSEFLYMQDKMNQDERALLKRVEAKTNEIHKKTGLTCGNSLYKYPDDVYGLMVYLRPCAMMYELMEKIGKEKVLEIMKTYYEKYQYSIATSNDFFQVASQVAKEDLTPFFNKWVYFK